MKDFLAGFDKLFPQIDELAGLYTYVEEAEGRTIPDPPRKPAEYQRPVPRFIDLNNSSIQSFAESCNLHPDEIAVVLESVFSSGNPIVVDAFKKLLTAAKICTNVGDDLAKHRDEIRSRKDAADRAMAEYNRQVRERKRLIKGQEEEIADRKASHRKVWLKYVRGLETRFNAAGGDYKKLAADDASVIKRAKRGTKKSDPFGFLRYQKGERCESLLRDVRTELKRSIISRGVRAALKGVKDHCQLANVIDCLGPDSANEVFDQFVSRLVFSSRDADGYPYFNTYAIRDVVHMGLGRKLKAAERWQNAITIEESNRDKLSRYSDTYHKYPRTQSIFRNERGNEFYMYENDEDYA